MTREAEAAPPEGTIASVVARNARERPDDLAFAEAASGAAITWRQYADRSSRIAATLSAAYSP